MFPTAFAKLEHDQPELAEAISDAIDAAFRVVKLTGTISELGFRLRAFRLAASQPVTSTHVKVRA